MNVFYVILAILCLVFLGYLFRPISEFDSTDGVVYVGANIMPSKRAWPYDVTKEFFYPSDIVTWQNLYRLKLFVGTDEFERLEQRITELKERYGSGPFCIADIRSPSGEDSHQSLRIVTSDVGDIYLSGLLFQAIRI